MSLHVRIGRLESTLASFDALVDRLSAPVLLVDGSGVLHYANSAGQEALRQARFLTLRNGRVWPRSARQERQFAETLAAAAVEPSASMLIHDGENRTAALIIQSLRGQADLICMPRADRVIFLVRAEERPPVDSVRLQVLYGLTPAETRLAEHLALGENLEEIGERFRLSRETLKSQLRSLFAKTRTGRQSELVALLLSSVSVPIA